VGSWAGARIAETSDVTWRQLVASNLDSSFWVLRGALRRMIPRRAGRVVLVSSMGALSPDPDAAAYGTVKAALLHLVDAAARETAGTGVTVNVVLPGTMDTAANRKAMPARDPSKWAKTEEVAAAAAFLLSDDAAGVNGARVTVPGTRA
jgi:NAD(P)-dependent dehydrogenase (short-subunit alcohol dehydrogenase family)